MPSFSDIKKGGWHPGGDKPISRSSIPGREALHSVPGVNHVRGLLGRDTSDTGRSDPRNHVSQPLSSLRDPSQFAPPPKHTNYHGAAAATQSTSPAPSAAARAPPAAPVSRMGGAIPQETIRQQQDREAARYREAEEEANRPPSPARPYRADTTGLSVAHLPAPPIRRPGTGDVPPTQPARRPQPTLPPRLPPRQNSRPDVGAPSPPPAYPEALRQPSPAMMPNASSLNRLGQAGVSVPGFDIGRQPAASPAPATPSSSQGHGGQLGELQSRFSRMSAASPSTETAPPSQGTSWAQKQSAFTTLRNAQKDPSSLSLSDARSAASTANNFRQRHGEQVASGMQAANGLNQKYRLSDRLDSFGGAGAAAVAASPESAAAATAKKAPPPPPPKKRELAAPPPPVPMSSKPR